MLRSRQKTNSSTSTTQESKEKGKKHFKSIHDGSHFNALDEHIEISTPYWWLIFLGIIGPSGTLVLNIALAYVSENWDNILSTHCRNWQFFPTISALIGNHAPFKYIWRFGIYIRVTHCLYSGFFLWHIHGQVTRSKWVNLSPLKKLIYRLLRVIMVVAYYLENLCLVGLTCVSSSEHYRVHELCFIFWGVFSITHMIALSIMCVMDLQGRRNSLRLLQSSSSNQSPKQLTYAKQLAAQIARRTRYFVVKSLLISTYIFMFGMAAYLFIRHNSFCEDGIYSMFALCEWTIVAINITFHGYVCFHDVRITTMSFKNDIARDHDHEEHGHQCEVCYDLNEDVVHLMDQIQTSDE
mmetsp:Transcript_5889/g.9132  ORF Transcript_5889/g.9132 Transcript_5889/m.9132 type:complete len:352 (+) Transcript_5889:32-1087(+)